MELQIYAYNPGGTLVHAAPHQFIDSMPLGVQCWHLEQIWRRWRDKYLSDRNPRNWKNSPKYHQVSNDVIPLRDSRIASIYYLVNPETGIRVGEYPV